MLTRELLIRYQRQNPRKYALKYGDKTPDAVMESLLPQPVIVDPSPVKVEVAAAENVETSFTQPVDPEVVAIAEKRVAAKKGSNAK